MRVEGSVSLAAPGGPVLAWPGRRGIADEGLGFRVSGLGFRVWGLGFRVSGLGFRV